MSGSSLAEILNKKRHGLKPTQTKVTNPDGSVQVFDHVGSTIVPLPSNIVPNQPDTGYGFVVDTKPDLSVGEIRPWLLVSSQDVPADPNLLKNLSVTHVLSLLPGFQLDPSSQPIQHLSLDLYDDDSSVLDSHVLKPAFDFISQAKSSGGRVLVHCNAGVSRAPSVVMLYLMAIEKMPFDTAWETVKTARSCAKPNSGFRNQLKNFNSDNSA